jgi:hypothetical protein
MGSHQVIEEVDDWVGYLRNFPTAASPRSPRCAWPACWLRRERWNASGPHRRGTASWPKRKRLAAEREAPRRTPCRGARAKSEELARRQEEKLNLETRRRRKRNCKERERQRLADERAPGVRSAGTQNVERRTSAEAGSLAREQRRQRRKRQAAEQTAPWNGRSSRKPPRSWRRNRPAANRRPATEQHAKAERRGARDRKPAVRARIAPAATVALDIRAGMRGAGPHRRLRTTPTRRGASARPHLHGRRQLCSPADRHPHRHRGKHPQPTTVTRVDHDEDRVEYNNGLITST